MMKALKSTSITDDFSVFRTCVLYVCKRLCVLMKVRFEVESTIENKRSFNSVYYIDMKGSNKNDDGYNVNFLAPSPSPPLPSAALVRRFPSSV